MKIFGFDIRLQELYHFDGKKVRRDKKPEGSEIFLFICRLFSIATVATFASFLAIKVFNKNLFDKIASSTKFAEFFFSKKFVLGVAITLGATLLLAKIVSAVLSCMMGDEESKKSSKMQDGSKQRFIANMTQSILGIGVAIAAITCASLILKNKFSAQNVDLLEKIFLGGFGSAIVIGVLASLITVIGKEIEKKKCKAVNSDNTDSKYSKKTNLQNHIDRYNLFLDVMHFLKGIFCHSAGGTLAYHKDDEKAMRFKDDYIALVEIKKIDTNTPKIQKTDANGNKFFYTNNKQPVMIDNFIGTGQYNIEANFLTFLNSTTDNKPTKTV